ncbi:cytochrome P450 [Hyphomicrobium sp.]|uniref:cytochrome P450 n=1 Tax=Hyphomicrobium sp. TaxID=82 RepID=UPI002E30D3E5|nr:cytochrome P450 [Hyphomicrobium sp.]HEX2841879.1 cytochrome P450 [Hyphomicrobium sp.]
MDLSCADPTIGDQRAFDWWSLLTASEFLKDPYARLAELRARGAVQHDAASGVYFVLGHKEFAQVAKSSRAGRDTRRWAGGWSAPEYSVQDPIGHRLFTAFQPQMINSDPPDHGRMRGVYEPAFHPQAVAALEPMIRAEADRLLDAMPEKGLVEMIGAFAGPLPLRVLCNLFDMPARMDADIARWSAALIKIGDIMMTPDQKREALDALEAFNEFLRGHLADLRRCPHSGLMGRVLAAEENGVLDEEETLVNLVSMLVAGHETTVTLIGNGLLLLLQNPRELARLRADRGLMRTAVEEFLRVEPGGNMILRIALDDIEVGGCRIPAGAPILGLIGAVNRDPRRFERPDVLDIGRAGNAHATFGGGIHFCVGASLARLEAQIAFGALLDRFADLALAGPAEWRLDRINARGLKCLPVRVGGAQ